MTMRVACCNLLTICAIASGITTIAAAPEPKYRPPSFDASVLVTDIEGCAVKIKENGMYQLNGRTQPSPGHFPRYCTVKLLAPVSYRVVITFDHSSEFACRQPSFIAVSDGANADQLAAVSPTEHLGVHLESANPTPTVICGQTAQDERNPSRFVSSTNLAEIFYALQDQESAVFSVKFIKEQLTCGEYIDMDHIDREITLTNNGQPGRCQVFLPGGSIVRIESIKLASDADADGNCAADGSYFHLKTGNSFFFLPYVSNKLCEVRNDQSTYDLPCKRAIAELVSNSFEREEVKIRFTLASHTDSVLGSSDCWT